MLPLQGGYAVLGKWDVIQDLHAELRAEMAELRQDVANALKLHRDELKCSLAQSSEGLRGAILEDVQSLRLIFPDALDAMRQNQRDAVGEIRADLNAGIDLLRQEFCQSFSRVLNKADDPRVQDRQEVIEEIRKSTQELAEEIRGINEGKPDVGEDVLSAVSPLMTHVLCIENRQAEMRDILNTLFNTRSAVGEVGESIHDLQLGFGSALSRIEARHEDMPNQIAGLVMDAIGDLDVHRGFDSISAEVGALRGSHALLLSDLLEEVRRGKTEMVQEIRIADLRASRPQMASKLDAGEVAGGSETCVQQGSPEVTLAVLSSCTAVGEAGE
jgi:hypothetical protein